MARANGRRGRRWTQAEDRTLLAEWSEVGPRRLRELLGGRTWAGIVARARKLGLHVGRMQGWETLREAAARTGMEGITLRRLLARHRVEPVRSRTRQREETRLRFYRPEDIDAAVERDVREMEIPCAAARRRGVAVEVLYRWLREDGALPPRRPAARAHHYVPSATIDAVLARHGWRPGGESIRAAARRHGMSPEALRRRVVAAGIELRTVDKGERLYLDPRAVDAAVAAYEGA